MKAYFAPVIILLAATTAQAKYTPVENPPLVPPPDETVIFTGPVGAMLESDYFRAPQTPAATSQIFPCRLRLEYFDKTRLAQSCR